MIIGRQHCLMNTFVISRLWVGISHTCTFYHGHPSWHKVSAIRRIGKPCCLSSLHLIIQVIIREPVYLQTMHTHSPPGVTYMGETRIFSQNVPYLILRCAPICIAFQIFIDICRICLSFFFKKLDDLATQPFCPTNKQLLCRQSTHPHHRWWDHISTHLFHRDDIINTED